MKSQELIHIAVAETSLIIRSGLVSALKRVPDLEIQTIEVTSKEGLSHCMDVHVPQVLFVDPQFEGWFDIQTFRESYPDANMKVVALVCNVVDNNQLKEYDERISLFDDLDTLTEKLMVLLNLHGDDEADQDALSQREREIIGCVVKGMTNKEIAEQLFISVHTVITHRRNITRKLQIHSAAGLTIYAIVHKLVELDEVKVNV